ncbi:MAG: pentapeptide repeat-containing protein, partial [Actinomycetota bacterium]
MVSRRGGWAARAAVPAAVVGLALLATGIAGAKVVNGCDIKAGAQCPGADLTRLDMEGESLAGADLTGANLTDAYITRSNLASINLTEATLTGANIMSGSMAGARLSGATGANLYLGDVGLRG